MAKLLHDIQNLDIKEESGMLTNAEAASCLALKNRLLQKLGRRRFKWRQRSKFKSIREGDKYTKFFRSHASHRNSLNKISILYDGERRLESKDITNHVLGFYKDLYAKMVAIARCRITFSSL